MRFHILFLSLLMVPFVLFGQTHLVSQQDKDDIYTLLQALIKDQKLDKTCRLVLRPEQNCTLHENDSNYLQTLMIKPKKKEDEEEWSLGKTIYVDMHTDIFTKKDIDNILRSKQAFNDFKWDNSRLGFFQLNKKNTYSFSVPLFNIKRDKAIFMYRYHCPGLCGNGYTMLATKTDNEWQFSILSAWYH